MAIGSAEVETFDIKFEEQQLTPRQLLQLLGTECGREIIHPNIWVNTTFRNHTDTTRWIITDVRFENEVKAIREHSGILIRVNRDTDKEDKHQSETGLDHYDKWDYVIENNGGLLNLVQRTKAIMLEYFKEDGST